MDKPVYKKFPPSSYDFEEWFTQFERMHRWYKRIKDHQNAAIGGGLSSEAEDCIYAFFQNCYHLRDWVIKSNVVPQKEVEQLIKSNIELQICRDICNGTKHMTLKHPSVGAEFSTYREYDWLWSGPGKGSKGGTTFRIYIAGEKYDLFDLADKCMKLWTQFLLEKKILIKCSP